MNHMMRLGMTAALLGACAGAASAAPETATETRTIDARVVRVNLEGVVNLQIRQGANAVLVLKGDPRLVGRTVATQHGDTLSIGLEGRGASLGRSSGVQAELVLPALRAVSSESVGSTTVNGFSGDALKIDLDGAGSMNVSSQFRVITASLGGVGSLRILDADSDSIELDLGGAGFVSVSGRSRSLKAELSGLGGLDAQKCVAESVKVELSGLGNATVNARHSADLELSGMGSVTVFGKPANRKVVVDGLGKVNWK